MQDKCSVADEFIIDLQKFLKKWSGDDHLDDICQRADVTVEDHELKIYIPSITDDEGKELRPLVEFYITFADAVNCNYRFYKKI